VQSNYLAALHFFGLVLFVAMGDQLTLTHSLYLTRNKDEFIALGGREREFMCLRDPQPIYNIRNRLFVALSHAACEMRFHTFELHTSHSTLLGSAMGEAQKHFNFKNSARF
jgi:hypothetical protein